jgi:hypothetical protein
VAGEDGGRRLFAAGVPDALRAAGDLLAEAAAARAGPYSGASPGELAKAVAGVEPFPEEGARAGRRPIPTTRPCPAPPTSTWSCSAASGARASTAGSRTASGP